MDRQAVVKRKEENASVYQKNPLFTLSLRFYNHL